MYASIASVDCFVSQDPGTRFVPQYAGIEWIYEITQLRISGLRVAKAWNVGNRKFVG